MNDPSVAQDQRYLRLRRYKRLLFPELVCPVHDEIGTPAASSKPSDYVWCHGKGADDGHWFTSESSAATPSPREQELLELPAGRVRAALGTDFLEGR